MATKILKVVALNTAPPLVLTATRAGAVVPLTSASKVELIITRGKTITNTGHQGCTITGAAAGVVSYVRQTLDVPSAGSWKCDLKVTYNDGTFEILYDQLLLKARKPAGT